VCGFRRDERRTNSGHHEGKAQREIAVLPDFDGPGYAFLCRPTVAMGKARTDIPHPSRNDSLGAPRPDKMIERDVGYGADRRKIPFLLAHELVTEGERDERLSG